MLKHLAVLAVAITAIGISRASQTAPLGTPKQGVTKEASGSGARVPAQGNEDKDDPGKVTVIFNQGSTPAPYPDKTKDDEDIQIQRKLAYLTAGLVVVGIIQAIALFGTVWVAIRQTRLMREHAGHLNNLAIAASANAQAAVASQRPWILVDVEVSKDNPDMFLVYGINKGQTPAEIFDGHCTSETHNPVNFVPPDNLRAPFLSPRQALTVNGDRFHVYAISRKRIEEILTKSPNQAMYVYGKISYWDTFTDRTKPENEHLTQWCFAYLTQIAAFGPAANDYATHT